MRRFFPPCNGEQAHRIVQDIRAIDERLSRRCRLLHKRGVLLSRFVQMGDRLIDLSDAFCLLRPARKCPLTMRFQPSTSCASCITPFFYVLGNPLNSLYRR